jgi:hypothetical protein
MERQTLIKANGDPDDFLTLLSVKVVPGPRQTTVASQVIIVDGCFRGRNTRLAGLSVL